MSHDCQMSDGICDHIGPSDAQLTCLEPNLPMSHSKVHVDDRHVLSGSEEDQKTIQRIVSPRTFINRNGLRWRDPPAEILPHRTLYYRSKRWGDTRRYKSRNRIVIMFDSRHGWRRVATHRHRCTKAFLSAIAVAASVIYWL